MSKNTTLVATATILSSLLLSSFAFAQDGNRGSNGKGSRGRSLQDTTTLTYSQGACVATAVGVREDAIIAAENTRNASHLSAMNTRKIELQASWNITEPVARKTARNAALKKFRDAEMAADKTLRNVTKSAYTTFNNAVTACGVTYKENPEIGMGVMMGGMHR